MGFYSLRFSLHAHTVKPALSDHVWAKKNWSLNGGGLLIEVEMHGHFWDRTKWSLSLVTRAAEGLQIMLVAN
jgi:hypothetical protein